MNLADWSGRRVERHPVQDTGKDYRPIDSRRYFPEMLTSEESLSETECPEPQILLIVKLSPQEAGKDFQLLTESSGL